MEKIIVAVGTQNKAKLEAVQSVFNRAFNQTVQVQSFDVESRVDKQPMDDETSIQGAANRAAGALEKLADATYGVGLEGNVATTAGKMYLRGWVVVQHRDGRVGIGHSGGVMLPAQIQNKVLAGQELGDVTKAIMNDEANNIRQTIGTNGVLSGGLYTRVNEFVHATECALAPFVEPKFYQ